MFKRVVCLKPLSESIGSTATRNRYASETLASAAWAPAEVHGTVARHDRAKQHTNSDFEQAGVLFRVVMTEDERARLVANIVGHLRHARRDIQGAWCVEEGGGGGGRGRGAGERGGGEGGGEGDVRRGGVRTTQVCPAVSLSASPVHPCSSLLPLHGSRAMQSDNWLCFSPRTLSMVAA